MENFKIEKDIKVICVKASSFPQGIGEAHQKLHSIIPVSGERKFFGISRPENGVIIYKAAAEILDENEPGKYTLETFVIPKGTYLCETLHDYTKDVSVIGSTFQVMLKHPGIDPQGFCLEWYIDNKNVRCMVRLA